MTKAMPQIAASVASKQHILHSKDRDRQEGMRTTNTTLHSHLHETSGKDCDQTFDDLRKQIQLASSTIQALQKR